MHPFFDIHTHHPTGNNTVVEMESVRFGQKPLALARYHSVGLHPWFLEATTMDAAKVWLQEQAESPAVPAIGEVGLDKVCSTPWDIQEAAFQYSIAESERVQKPLIIHSVKAYNEIIQVKKLRKPAQVWIFHGFNKHPDTARMLLREDCFLSFGAALLQPGNHATQALQQTPADRFFLETDDAEQIDIAAIYEKAAALRGISLLQLKEQIAQNVQHCFGIT